MTITQLYLSELLQNKSHFSHKSKCLLNMYCNLLLKVHSDCLKCTLSLSCVLIQQLASHLSGCVSVAESEVIVCVIYSTGAAFGGNLSTSEIRRGGQNLKIPRLSEQGLRKRKGCLFLLSALPPGHQNVWCGLRIKN
ncbi:hypothetical protein XENOCAPTIV_025563 [Xenoophorus captivus]|uniref:Uncharacterized protein n=1 Tax=Xenoophorus captivus TaxID=1517983 RepID=A0ABV0QY50_9TELE